MGTPVVFLDPRSKGAESYKAFAWEFMAKNPTRYDSPAPESAVKKGGAGESPSQEEVVKAPAAETAVETAGDVAPASQEAAAAVPPESTPEPQA